MTGIEREHDSNRTRPPRRSNLTRLRRSRPTERLLRVSEPADADIVRTGGCGGEVTRGGERDCHTIESGC